MINGRCAAFSAQRTSLRAALPVILSLLLYVPDAGAQTAVPPNPVPVPRVNAPVMQTPLSPPTVAAPVLSAPATVTGGAPAAGGAQDAAAKPAGAAGTQAGRTSALPDTLDEMTSPVSLLNALSGSGTEGQGLDALTTLLGGGGLSALAGSSATGGSTVDQATLAKILALLEKQQADAEAQKTAGTPGAARTSGVSAQKNGAPAVKAKPVSGAEIVRFTVNRTDIAATAADVVSSSLAKDGSFLLTGRRPGLGETFYLVCRKTGSATYRLFADLGQDYPNEKSWLYQLARKTPLEGSLTGDLLVFRTVDPAWNLDLVIRVITPSVAATTVR